MTEPIKDGGPAFPIPLGPEQSWQGMAPCDGMTLRDYFAAKSLQGMLSDRNTILSFSATAQSEMQGPDHLMAAAAYKMADAMLRARRQGDSE